MKNIKISYENLFEGIKLYMQCRSKVEIIGGAKCAAGQKNWCLCGGSLDWLKLPLPVLVLSLCSSSFLVFRWIEN